MRTIEGTQQGGRFKFAIVVAKYHDFITDKLLASAIAALEAAGVPSDAVTVIRVPGAFEIPIAARHAGETGEFAAVICLGCLIRGGTPHFEYIASAVSHGVTAAAGDTGVPMAFGVITTNSVEDAFERAGDGPSNKGWEAATAAIEMAGVVAALVERDE